MRNLTEYKEFFIDKSSHTYAETLEAYGLAALIDEILLRSNVSNRKVEILDKGTHYLLIPGQEIKEEMLTGLNYFQVIKFLKDKSGTKIPDDIGDNFYDYPNQKKEFDAIKDAKKKVEESKRLSSKERKNDYMK